MPRGGAAAVVGGRSGWGWRGGGCGRQRWTVGAGQRGPDGGAGEWVRGALHSVLGTQQPVLHSEDAPEAAAAIHTDFFNKFIRAEVIAWDKLIEAGSRAKARELGAIRTEGKEYIVKDGDVIEFLHG